MEGTTPIDYIEPVDVGSSPAGLRQPAQEKTWRLYAVRRDTAGSEFIQDRSVSVLADSVFRVRIIPGLRPTTDGRIVDVMDGGREYRVERVVRLKLYGAAVDTHWDLFGQFRGSAA